MIAGPTPLFGRGEVNVRCVAAFEFEDWPDRGAYLLALHISGVTGNEERADSDERRNDRAIAESRVCFLLIRHNGDANYFQVIAKSFVSRAIFCAIDLGDVVVFLASTASR